MRQEVAMPRPPANARDDEAEESAAAARESAEVGVAVPDGSDERPDDGDEH
jgi:hypothetical protein